MCNDVKMAENDIKSYSRIRGSSKQDKSLTSGLETLQLKRKYMEM